APVLPAAATTPPADRPYSAEKLLVMNLTSPTVSCGGVYALSRVELFRVSWPSSRIAVVLERPPLTIGPVPVLPVAITPGARVISEYGRRLVGSSIIWVAPVT